MWDYLFVYSYANDVAQWEASDQCEKMRLKLMQDQAAKPVTHRDTKGVDRGWIS